MHTTMGLIIGLTLFCFQTLFSQSFIESHRRIEHQNIDKSAKQLKLSKRLSKDSVNTLNQGALIKLSTEINLLKDAFLQYSHKKSFNYDTASSLNVFLCYDSTRNLKMILSISGRDTLLYKTTRTISDGFFNPHEFTEHHDAKLETLLTYSLTKSRQDLIDILTNNRTFDALQLVTLSAIKILNEYKIEFYALNPFIYGNTNK